ncbi:DNA repair protein RecN [Fulvivirgaceae bacterium BMA10]|uniref:DNA repair protein RecN n=1 Tax=Splendidivirga corallicola TaxID=3051826 RepID=A0ABT8KID0_9BACT|nr:DNA repair protein RecN [Fulvivirgaceae bacterium BMA10]
MLIHLTIRNYALIKELEIDPSANLNIITGETGAGKSIMLGAVGLLLGNRADTKALFNDQEKCVIEGIFEISDYPLKPLFDQEELDYESQTIIRREIATSGKSRAFINDTPVTLEVLKKIGSYLMDVHSQNDTLLLGTNKFQLSLVDSYARNKEKLLEYETLYTAYLEAKKNYETLIDQAQSLKAEADYNQFLLTELVEAQLEDGQQEEWEKHLKILENAESIKTRLNEALNLLDSSDYSINNNLYTLSSIITHIAPFSDKFQSIKERLESCYIELRDVHSELEQEDTNIEYNQEEAESLKEKLNIIYQLQQKHRAETVSELLTIQNTLKDKAHKVDNLDQEIESSKKNMESCYQSMIQCAKEVSKIRTNEFKNISKAIIELLKDLGIPDAMINIENTIIDPGPSGIDDVKLLFSANKGIAPQELKNVASGGEFSRLMFCIKYILADKVALPTIVFDEIDTGVSGEIAIKMIMMMKEMAQNHQVIAISHLPQFAARGDAHYYVYKDNSTDKTVSKIRKLSEDERVEEIAKMIGGDNPTNSAFENARQLMNLTN